jgi:hypothetical protein
LNKWRKTFWMWAYLYCRHSYGVQMSILDTFSINILIFTQCNSWKTDLREKNLNNASFLFFFSDNFHAVTHIEADAMWEARWGKLMWMLLCWSCSCGSAGPGWPPRSWMVSTHVTHVPWCWEAPLEDLG